MFTKEFTTFDPTHFLILGGTLLLMAVAIFLIFKFKPSFKLVFTIASILSIISEVVKTFSTLEFLPIVGETGEVVPYISMGHFPLHLCAIQVFLIIIVWRLKEESSLRTTLLAFMFPTMILGATLALILPGDMNVLNPRTYQYFLFHGMLVVLGIYIMLNKDMKFKPKHYLTSLGLLGLFGLVSIYANSLFANITYENGERVLIQDIPNLFFTMRSPVGFLPKFTEPYHWYIYLGCVLLIAVTAFTLFYIPIFVKALKKKSN